MKKSTKNLISLYIFAAFFGVAMAVCTHLIIKAKPPTREQPKFHEDAVTYPVIVCLSVVLIIVSVSYIGKASGFMTCKKA